MGYAIWQGVRMTAAGKYSRIFRLQSGFSAKAPTERRGPKTIMYTEPNPFGNETEPLPADKREISGIGQET